MSATDDDQPIDLTHKRLPTQPEDEGRRHRWGAAPPGQGRQRTCRLCGQRLTVVGVDSACPGQHSVAVAETLHSYDPFSD